MIGILEAPDAADIPSDFNVGKDQEAESSDSKINVLTQVKLVLGLKIVL